MAFLIGGAVVVAGLGYLYYSNQKSESTETNNDKTDDANKIEQITYAGDNEEETNQSKQNQGYDEESKDNEAPSYNDQAPDTEEETKENQGNVDDTESAKPEMDKETEEAIKEEEPKKEEPKEESPVIVQREEEVVVVDTEATKPEPPKPTKEELESAEKKQQEEARLNKLIQKYDKIAVGVSKMKKFKYKNGKIKVRVLRATNVDDKDPGLNKKNVSDALVKLTITNSKDHPKTSFKKDQTNPVWNESFELSVKDALREILTAEVQDHDTLSNDLIGTVKIPVIDVVASKDSCVKNREFKVKGSKTGCKLYLDLEYAEDNKSTGKGK